MITTMSSPHTELSPQQHVKSLVQQLCPYVKHLKHSKLQNLDYNWRDLGGELISLMGTRINPDTKRAVAECLGALGFLLAAQYDQFVKFIVDAAKRSSDKYPEERTMILRSLANSLNFIGVCCVQSRIAPPHIEIVHDKKGVNKEQRIAACDELQKILLSLETITLCPYVKHLKHSKLQNLDYNWRDLGGELISLMGTRINPDTKRAVAECLGALGFLLAAQYDQFVKFIVDAAKRSSDKYPEERTMILRSLANSLNFIGVCCVQSRIAPPHIEDVMAAVKKQLDTNDSPTVLIPLLDICLAVAQYFPAVFKKSFDDIVDFTVGWYVEPDQPKSVVEKCAQMLTDLRPFWFDALPTAVTLMKQFVDDASAYLEELVTDKATRPDEALRKTAAILRALVTVLSVVNVPQAQPIIVPFVEKVFDNMSREMTAPVVQMVIGPEGAVHGLVHGSREVIHAMIDLYAKLLTPKALPTLQAAYHCVRTELIEALSEMESNAKGEEFDYWSTTVAEKRTLVILNALATLGAVKNSLIAMMGLTPSLFVMLMCETPVAEKWFVVNYPGCHYALLYVVKMHSEKHDNFIANSGWLNERNRLPMLTEGPTANHFARILNTLAKLLLIDDAMWYDTRNLVIDWVHGIAFGMNADVLQEVLERTEMIEMRRALLESFLRHSLPKKTISDQTQKSNTSTATANEASRLSGARVRYFTLLRRLGVFNLVLDGGPEVLVNFVTRVFERSRDCEQDKSIGFWQAIPPALFMRGSQCL
ncbi:Serine/threonine-protein kinase SMG1 [Toxocara canis]|uniref:Serine/threonine-protein kinase SMG1 n=1 Tax=Toxocara canis TaxID=6265 RepID=A0A0B2VTS4_TOXCA|nr:Serine/threonine-protein kinase SMG1 [Toxocara canis]